MVKDKKVTIKIPKNLYRELENICFALKFDVNYFVEQLIIYSVDLANLFYKSSIVILNKDKFDKELIEFADFFLNNFYMCLEYFKNNEKEDKRIFGVKRIDIKFFGEAIKSWDLVKNKLTTDDFGVIYGASSFFNYFKNENGVFSVSKYFEFYLFFIVELYLNMRKKVGFIEFKEMLEDIVLFYKEVDVYRIDNYYKFEGFFVALFMSAFGKLYLFALNIANLNNDDVNNFIDDFLEDYKKYTFIEVKHKRDFENLRIKKMYKQLFSFKEKTKKK
jgi:hypothetical protein